MTGPDAGALEAATAAARQVIGHHFGRGLRSIEHKSSGLSNFVFAVTHDEGEYVVRISEAPAKINSYIKEQWAVGRARAEGVPVPEILEVGNEVIPHPYMISRTVEGVEAAKAGPSSAILGELGRLARRINSIPTSGFGTVFDWSGNQLSRNDTWLDYARGEWGLERRLAVLGEHGGLPGRQVRRLRTLVERADSRQPPALNHGDLRLKNVLVAPGGEIAAILDWENCLGSLAPQWELSIALHDLNVDEMQAFLAGYGLGADEFARLAPLVKAINILNYVPQLEAASEAENPGDLERLRQRLSGALDLYSL